MLDYNSLLLEEILEAIIGDQENEWKVERSNLSKIKFKKTLDYY